MLLLVCSRLIFARLLPFCWLPFCWLPSGFLRLCLGCCVFCWRLAR